MLQTRGGSRGGAIAPPKTYESNFFHYNFVQFGKKLDCQILLQSPPLNLWAGSAPVSNFRYASMA